MRLMSDIIFISDVRVFSDCHDTVDSLSLGLFRQSHLELVDPIN